MTAELVEKNSIRVGDVLENGRVFEKIQVGDKYSRVIEHLGQPLFSKQQGSGTENKYSSTWTARRGKTYCLIWLPIPMRNEEPGYHLIKVENDEVVKIHSYETVSGFTGLWVDDSGFGFANGEVSKCNM